MCWFSSSHIQPGFSSPSTIKIPPNKYHFLFTKASPSSLSNTNKHNSLFHMHIHNWSSSSNSSNHGHNHQSSISLSSAFCHQHVYRATPYRPLITKHSQTAFDHHQHQTKTHTHHQKPSPTVHKSTWTTNSLRMRFCCHHNSHVTTINRHY